jgi:hypothetical protein
MTIAEASVKAVCEYIDRLGKEVVTCDEVFQGMNRSRSSVRETLSVMAKRGLIEKMPAPRKSFCGNTLLYRRTSVPYVPLENNVDRYDFSELLAAWKVRACQAWVGSSRTHECVDDQPAKLKFGEFADGTCL